MVRKLISLLFACSVLNAWSDDLSRQTHPIDAEKELLIINPAVVDSPMANYPGVWSFGHLMEQLAGNEGPSAFVRTWLENWEQDLTINKQTLAAREKITKLVIEPWMAKDGFAGSPREEWQVNLANAPFRLLAIVNRIDTGAFVQVSGRSVSFNGSASGARYYGPVNTGEARFVFGVNDPDGEPLDGGFTVIFEYNLPVPNTSPAATALLDAQPSKLARMLGDDADGEALSTRIRRQLVGRMAAADYAARWHALGSHPAFDDGYFCALSELTLEVTERTDAENGPPLAQLRTNEGALGDIQEAREFDYVANSLTPQTVAATPALAFNGEGDLHGDLTAALAKYINSNQRAILRNTHTVPTSIASPNGLNRKPVPFLAASSLMPLTDVATGKTSFRWNVDGVRYGEALRHFSLNTCSGCHCGETDTQFYHIHPRRAGEQSRLSAFLRLDDSKLTVERPGPRKRSVDLNEMHERRVIFETILNPGFDEKDVLDRIRRRSRRGH